jgi:membrane protein YqaA with SNARE-associated domain
MAIEQFFMSWFATYGLLGIFIAALIANASIIFPVPMDIIVFGVAGLSDSLGYALLLGFFAGIGAGIGEMSAYILGVLGISTAERVMKKPLSNIEEYQEKLRKKGMVFVFIASLTPIPFDLVGIIAGLIRYDWRKFLIAGILGKLVRYELIALAGFYGLQLVRTYFFF